jgi:hypothetical protein
MDAQRSLLDNPGNANLNFMLTTMRRQVQAVFMRSTFPTRCALGKLELIEANLMRTKHRNSAPIHPNCAPWLKRSSLKQSSYRLMAPNWMLFSRSCAKEQL